MTCDQRRSRLALAKGKLNKANNAYHIVKFSQDKTYDIVQDAKNAFLISAALVKLIPAAFDKYKLSNKSSDAAKNLVNTILENEKKLQAAAEAENTRLLVALNAAYTQYEVAQSALSAASSAYDIERAAAIAQGCLA